MKTKYFLSLAAFAAIIFQFIFCEKIHSSVFYENYDSQNKSIYLERSNSGCLPQINSWVSRYTGVDEYDEPAIVLTDSCGNVFVTGYSTGQGEPAMTTQQ